MNSNIANTLTCPITSSQFIDPVIASDGRTYERSAIEEWLKISNLSPITKETITKTLVTNWTIKSQLDSLNNTVVMNNTATYEDKISLTHTVNVNKEYLHIQLNIPESDDKVVETVVICVIDNSGSMDTKIQAKGESNSLTRLSLVKHATKTVIKTIPDNAYLGLVKFSDSASVLFDITKMTDINKSLAIQSLDNLNTEGRTNIWDGLRVALDLTNNEEYKNKNISIVLLTDGEPNINPPRGIYDTLKLALDRYGKNININTFGFGYDLDSKLLDDIAKLCIGTYAYIPDCTMVGTVFVNYISSVLSTKTNNINISIEANNINPVTLNGYKYVDNFKLGSILKSRNIIINHNDFNESFEYHIKITGPNINEMIIHINSLHISNLDSFIDAILQSRLIKSINNIIDSNLTTMNPLIDTAVFANTCKTIFSENVLLDILNNNDPNLGQVYKALSNKDWYDKWGKHYILSFLCAHRLEQCLNFKDKSMQDYGSNLFLKLRDSADQIFCSLPPPKSEPIYSYGGQITQPFTQVNMSSYYDANGGCFTGNSKIIIFINDQEVAINMSDLKIDHLVKTPNGYSKIKCIVKNMVSNEGINICNFNSFGITEWHPIKIKQWIFPNQLVKPEKQYLDIVYNLVLEKDHIVYFGSFEACTLGHMIKDNDIIYHPYYGTNKVIKDLEKIPGYELGEITIKGYKPTSSYITIEDNSSRKMVTSMEYIH